MRKISKINMVLALVLFGIIFFYMANIYNNTNIGVDIMEQEIKAKVTLYTKPSCGYCMRAKSFLDDMKVPYSEVDVSNDRSKHEELMDQTGSRTVPYIFINEDYIGGFTDMLKMAEEGTFEKMLVM